MLRGRRSTVSLAGLAAVLLVVAVGAAQARRLDDSAVGPLRIRIASPARGATVSATVSWQVTVLSGVPAQMDFSVDGRLIQSLKAAPFAVSLDTTALPDGVHVLTASARAGAGSASDTVSVNVSNQGHKRPPSNTNPPAITGAAQVGQTLTASSGSWSGSQPMTYAFKWLRCDGSGANCANIAGATSTSYLLTSADQGSTVRVSVTATNSYGSSSAQSSPTAIVTAPGGGGKHLYWGAWIGNQFTGTDAPWDMNAVADFESLVGKKLSIINFSSPWANCYNNPCTNYNFDGVAFNNVRNHGAIPFFSWGSDSLPFSNSEPDLALGKIIAGNWDSYITSWATAAKNWGHPFFLRFNWEMNGNWFPWAEGVNGNTSGQYVQAWRHVHDIFTSVGATNVTWVWCPNVDPNNSYTPLASLYPGAAYVDWTCLDGYNWDSPWMGFDQLYSSTYQKIVGSIAPSKPMAIGEQASTEKGGSKASWINAMLSNMTQTYPQVGAVLWFEKYDNGMDWPVETSSSATSAFASSIASSTYLTNQFGSLGSGTIPPPS